MSEESSVEERLFVRDVIGSMTGELQLMFSDVKFSVELYQAAVGATSREDAEAASADIRKAFAERFFGKPEELERFMEDLMLGNGVKDILEAGEKQMRDIEAARKEQDEQAMNVQPKHRLSRLSKPAGAQMSSEAQRVTEKLNKCFWELDIDRSGIIQSRDDIEDFLSDLKKLAEEIGVTLSQKELEKQVRITIKQEGETIKSIEISHVEKIVKVLIEIKKNTALKNP